MSKKSIKIKKSLKYISKSFITMDESFTTDENVDLDNVVEEEEETITSGSSTAGDI